MAHGFLAEEEAMIPGYASEKLASAVGYMACSNETLQKRLEVAYSEFHSLIPADFSEELGEKYLDIVSQLTKKGSMPATAATMTDHEAFGIAAAIVNLFFAVVGVKEASPVFNTASFL
jgi:hypothetical protein